MTKEEYSKIGAFDKLMNHLSIAVKDPRKRERVRAKLATFHMNKYYKESEDEYENRNTTKN